jgi:hypothetical protein
MEPMSPLTPGHAHPHGPCRPAELARFVHVDIEQVLRWVALGMPTLADGRIDPFSASNWLSAGRLDECPALARRWRTYLVWFAPFVAGQDRARKVRWTRTHRLYLPSIPVRLSWWLPAVAHTQGQFHLAERLPLADALTTTVEDRFARLEGVPANSLPVARGEVEIGLHPTAVMTPGDDDHRALAPLVEEVAGTFRYEYRHHRGDDWVHDARPPARAAGSCLDCALALGARLDAIARPWRLVAGLVANTAIANPHFWLEAQVIGGRWAPLDPSLPAIVRMVGGDWRAAARAWTGALDARRITLGVVGAGVPGIPGGASVGSAMGEAVATGVDGVERSAWPCLDWVCGDCEAEFSEIG